MSLVVDGVCDARFSSVRDAFETIIAADELGAALAVMRDGRPVVDLWGGWADAGRTRPWQRDTLVHMQSVNKGMTALCALHLIDRGRMALDAPVTRYWPEYGANGKERTTVEQMLAHRAGVFFFSDTVGAPVENWDRAVAALAARPPAYEPGTRGCYHVLTYGHLVGELVRRVGGTPVETYFAREIAGPLDADYHFAVPDDALGRVADIAPPQPGAETLGIDPNSLMMRIVLSISLPDRNSTAFRQLVFPSGSGHGNARAVARIFAPLSGQGAPLLSPALVSDAGTVRWPDGEVCFVTGSQPRVGLGLFRNDGGDRLGPEPSAIFTAGWGGHIALADPVRRLSIGYCSNSNAPAPVHAAALRAIDAVYAALGETGLASAWSAA